MDTVLGSLLNWTVYGIHLNYNHCFRVFTVKVQNENIFLSIFFGVGGGGEGDIFNSKYIWGKGYAWYACFLAGWGGGCACVRAACSFVCLLHLNIFFDK